MLTSYQLLLIAPNTGFSPSPSPDFLKSIAYEVLGVKPPTPIDKIINVMTQAGANFGILRRISRRDKDMRVYEQEALIVELLQALYSRDITSILPDAYIVKQGDLSLKQFKCVGDEFKVNYIYSSHPKDSKYFIPLANFHNYLQQEKAAEFINLAISLGAKEVKLVDNKSQKKNVNVSAGITEPTGHADINSNFDLNRNSDATFDLSIKTQVATAPPTLPDKLIWYKEEPLWVAMANARLRNWVTEFKVCFTYLHDFSINSNLIAKASGVGLNVGGSFNDAIKIKQEYTVEFFSKDDYTNLI